MSEKQILVTLGPASMNRDTIEKCEKESVNLFRINLSHTKLEDVEPTIKRIRDWTNIPICLDSEGAQIRNEKMKEERVFFEKGSLVKIHHKRVIGDSNNISFTPHNIAKQFIAEDRINVDFDSVRLKVIEIKEKYSLAIVEMEGFVGWNKAVDIGRGIKLDAITKKDKAAIEIGKRLGIKNFALSFAQSSNDVEQMRALVGKEATLICKIESISGVVNLNEILNHADQILIDRGDLSRQIPNHKIPFLQRRIISLSRSQGKPVFVATNLLESMTNSRTPTRAELNDVVSTLIMGANGLVLASETAIGKYPVAAVQNIRNLIEQFEKWTTNTSIKEILDN